MKYVRIWRVIIPMYPIGIKISDPLILNGKEAKRKYG
jgi:hypothetical protein